MSKQLIVRLERAKGFSKLDYEYFAAKLDEKTQFYSFR